MSDIDAILDAAAANATFEQMAVQIEAALIDRKDFDAQRALRYISIIRDRLENATDKETGDRIEECARYALRLGLILHNPPFDCKNPYQFADSGALLRSRIEDRGFTQAEFARRINMKYKQLQQYTTGQRRPKQETMERMNRALEEDR